MKWRWFGFSKHRSPLSRWDRNMARYSFCWLMSVARMRSPIWLSISCLQPATPNTPERVQSSSHRHVYCYHTRRPAGHKLCKQRFQQTVPLLVCFPSLTLSSPRSRIHTSDPSLPRGGSARSAGPSHCAGPWRRQTYLFSKDMCAKRPDSLSRPTADLQ